MRKRLIILPILMLAVLCCVIVLTVRIPLKHPFMSGRGKADTRQAFNVRSAKLFSFSGGDALKEWEEKVFKGRVVYTIEKDQDVSYVRAQSAGSASALYYKIKLDAKDNRPTLSWKWRVDRFPVKAGPESLETENEDDFAARVYVIFPALFITNYKVLEYIWAESLPVGSVGTSHYSKNIKLIVLESGKARDDKFVVEERDIVGDYINVFGEPPEHDIGAVAFMTNAEHTNTSADALYDEIDLGYKEI